MRSSPSEHASWKKYNLHSHTNCSDGWTTPMESLRFAMARNLCLSITDHNTVQALEILKEEGARDPKVRQEVADTIIPGMEIQTRERTELLLYTSTIDQAIEFFRREIQEKLNGWDPKYLGADLSIHDLIKRARDHELVIGIPHLKLWPHGLASGSLSAKEFKDATRLLTDYRKNVYVEQTPVLGRIANAAASTYARIHRMRVLANADSHLSDHDASYTWLPENTEHRSPLDHVMTTIRHRRPRRHERHMEHMNWFKSLKLGMRIGWKTFPHGIMDMAYSRLGSSYRIDIRRDVPSPLAEILETADAGGAGDS